MNEFSEYRMRKELRDEFNDRLPEMRDNPYWQDDISEMADSFVSIYNSDRVDQWRALGCPEIDDPGMIEGVTDIFQIIAVAIYEWASAYLYELANDAELD